MSDLIARHITSNCEQSEQEHILLVNQLLALCSGYNTTNLFNNDQKRACVSDNLNRINELCRIVDLLDQIHAGIVNESQSLSDFLDLFTTFRDKYHLTNEEIFDQISKSGPTAPMIIGRISSVYNLANLQHILVSEMRRNNIQHIEFDWFIVNRRGDIVDLVTRFQKIENHISERCSLVNNPPYFEEHYSLNNMKILIIKRLKNSFQEHKNIRIIRYQLCDNEEMITTGITTGYYN